MTRNTSQALYQKYQSLPDQEQSKFRALLSEENRTHEEVFGHLRGAQFNVHQAIEYLGSSEATFRRWLSEKRITASSSIGRSHLYLLEDLKQLKRAQQKVGSER